MRSMLPKGAMQPLGGQDMGPDQRMDRLQRHGAGADLVSQGGQADLDTFLGVALDLPVQRLMLAELLEQDHRKQVGPSPATGCGMERRWRLADLLACPAGELLADRLDHLPLPGNDLERFGDILAHLHDAIRAAAGTGRGRRNHHALARQMLREGFAGRAATFEPRDGRGLHYLLGGDRVFSGCGLELLKLQFHLVDQAGAALGAVAILLAPELGDLEPEMLDHRFRGRDHRPGLRQLALCGLGTGLRGRKRGAQSGDLGSGI